MFVEKTLKLVDKLKKNGFDPAKISPSLKIVIVNKVSFQQCE